MSQLSLADTLVEWSIFALRAAATLPADLQIVPFVSGEEAESERLIVKCETGARLLEGGNLYQCQLSFELRTVTRNSDAANDIFAKVETAIAGSPAASAITRARQLFKEVFIFTESTQTTLDHSTNVRSYTRTIPIQTALA